MSWTARPSRQRIEGANVAADSAADTYFAWLDQTVPGVRAVIDGSEVRLHVWGMSNPAISLRRRESDRHLASFDVIGGVLVRSAPSGEFRFESREAGLDIALVDFAPVLPRPLFYLTHALVHDAVMTAYCRHVQPRTSRPEKP